MVSVLVIRYQIVRSLAWLCIMRNESTEYMDDLDYRLSDATRCVSGEEGVPFTERRSNFEILCATKVDYEWPYG